VLARSPAWPRLLSRSGLQHQPMADPDFWYWLAAGFTNLFAHASASEGITHGGWRLEFARIERYGWMMTGFADGWAPERRYPLVASGCAWVERSVCCISNGWRCFWPRLSTRTQRPIADQKDSVRRLSRQYLFITGVVYLLFRYVSSNRRIFRWVVGDLCGHLLGRVQRAKRLGSRRSKRSPQ